MKTQPNWPRFVGQLTSGLCACLVAVSLNAQTADDSNAEDDNELIMLSPFVVSSEKDVGYVAASTLAGSRLNTSLLDTPASISVFTREFLNDIDASSVAESLEYTLNGSKSNDDYTGNGVQEFDLRVQMRGFVGASLGRNYFPWRISSDTYNVDRLDFSRGPNSVLYGIGGPGGIINTTTKRAILGTDQTELKLRVGSYNDVRATVDVTRPLGEKAAARINLLFQDRDGWREFEYEKKEGVSWAATYQPFKNTIVRLDGEYRKVEESRPQPWPAADKITPWLDAGSIPNTVFPAAVGTYSGGSFYGNRGYVYDPLDSSGPMVLRGGRVSASTASSPALGNNATSMKDFSIIPFNSNLQGPGNTTDNKVSTASIFVEQRIGENLFIEAAYNHQTEARDWRWPVGFTAVAAQADINTLLPDGSPNPHFGDLYVEGQAAVFTQDLADEDLRLTGSYKLDLRDHNKWLGVHNFAALVSRRYSWFERDVLNEVNLTPAGNATYPLNLTAANNLIYRRTYLDFSSNDPRKHGALDPWEYPLTGQNGVTSGWVRRFDFNLNELTTITTKMIAGQSELLDRRLILTWGLRNDRQAFNGSTSDLDGSGSNANDRDPVTQEFPLRVRLKDAVVNDGNTRTYGGVFHITKWMAAFYNNSDSFIPQSDLDLNGIPVGSRMGLGEDYGLRFSLPDNKLYLSVARYNTADANSVIGQDSAILNSINEIWEAMGTLDTKALVTTSRGSQDLAGKGWEIELTANPLKNWRMSVNFAQTEQVTTNIHPVLRAYIEGNRSLWTQNSALPLVAPYSSVPAPASGEPTILDAINRADGIMAGIQAGDGNIRRQLVEYTGNVFTSYRFSDGALKGFTIGGGANYRGDAVLGYDTSNNNAPIKGSSYTLFNLMLGWDHKINDKTRLRLQMNVNNMFDKDDLIVTDADQNQAYRYLYQRPRSISLTSTLTF